MFVWLLLLGKLTHLRSQMGSSNLLISLLNLLIHLLCHVRTVIFSNCILIGVAKLTQAKRFDWLVLLMIWLVMGLLLSGLVLNSCVTKGDHVCWIQMFLHRAEMSRCDRICRLKWEMVLHLLLPFLCQILSKIDICYWVDCKGVFHVDWTIFFVLFI